MILVSWWELRALHRPYAVARAAYAAVMRSPGLQLRMNARRSALTTSAFSLTGAPEGSARREGLRGYLVCPIGPGFRALRG
jgi:hypothetical protein